jgi:hypothetical protein
MYTCACVHATMNIFNIARYIILHIFLFRFIIMLSNFVYAMKSNFNPSQYHIIGKLEYFTILNHVYAFKKNEYFYSCFSF